MPISNFLKSAAGTCPYCNHKAGILSREHNECRRAYKFGLQERKTPANPVNANRR